MAIFEQLEVERKYHKSNERDNALVNMENKLSLCV